MATEGHMLFVKLPTIRVYTYFFFFIYQPVWFVPVDQIKRVNQTENTESKLILSSDLQITITFDMMICSRSKFDIFLRAPKVSLKL